MFSVMVQTVSYVWATRKPHYDIRRHWKNDEIVFQNVYGHRESAVLRVQVMFITYCFCDFLFHGYPCMTKEKGVL